MNVVHLTDSPFFGGPERQMLGLARALPESIHTSVLCFREGETCAPFLERLHGAGIAARMLRNRNPHLQRMVKEVRDELRCCGADLLLCHGYKADIIGWLAARWRGVPVAAVSRGWTAHTWKVRLNEALGRRVLPWMDAVVCVSRGQAEKIERAGVAKGRVVVIHNAIDTSRFREAGGPRSQVLRSLFSSRPDQVVLGVGRLSPEKGFEQLVEAARLVVSRRPSTGFVLVGEGPERENLRTRISRAGLDKRFVLAGFRSDVDQLVPTADVLAQSSYTEGLPNVLLEACAAGRPVVATNVGGSPEVIQDGVNGFLVPPGDARTLAVRLLHLLESPARGLAMGEHGRRFVASNFSFEKQSASYQALFETLVPAGARAP